MNLLSFAVAAVRLAVHDYSCHVDVVQDRPAANRTLRDDIKSSAHWRETERLFRPAHASARFRRRHVAQIAAKLKG
jgi:hypothetical protein